VTYTVNDKCIMCKHTDCVEVCPVDCFYEGENMLDTDLEGKRWVEFNNKWSLKWPVITTRKDPLPDHAKHSGEQGRLEKYFKDK